MLMSRSISLTQVLRHPVRAALTPASLARAGVADASQFQVAPLWQRPRIRAAKSTDYAALLTSRSRPFGLGSLPTRECSRKAGTQPQQSRVEGLGEDR
jgi:hypothetical protein